LISLWVVWLGNRLCFVSVPLISGKPFTAPLNRPSYEARQIKQMRRMFAVSNTFDCIRKPTPGTRQTASKCKDNSQCHTNRRVVLNTNNPTQERVNKYGASAILCVSPRTVVTMARKGQLPGARTNGSVLKSLIANRHVIQFRQFAESEPSRRQKRSNASLLKPLIADRR